MLRPHNRVSFIHTDWDMENILADMEAFIELGADGFVFGALLPDRSIDIDKCKLVIEHARGRPVTFHRAFDMSVPADMLNNVELLSKLGFQRLLTSGLAETAELGIPTLKTLNECVTDKHLNIVIMPGCGITPKNAERILTETGCREFHGSAKHKVIESIPAHVSDTQAITAATQANSLNYASQDIVAELAAIKAKVIP